MSVSFSVNADDPMTHFIIDDWDFIHLRLMHWISMQHYVQHGKCPEKYTFDELQARRSVPVTGLHATLLSELEVVHSHIDLV